ncbi:SagB/ThcOx family dehydrogenase [Mycolicibacterium litorale]|uniref:SagB/ThcOx family dehydrogenase n=1 Tax=Mycolicibacterium litorale TaxID=758802 RepID=UPI003CFB2B36
MKRREVLVGLAAAAAVAQGCAGQRSDPVRPSEPPPSPARFTDQIALPKPSVAGTVSLEDAIQRRRSVRTFRPDPLPVGTIGQLLWAGQGVTAPDGRRAAPSAGASYPLELYTVTAAEVMHYLPDGHRAETRATSDLRPQLKAAALDQASVGAAPLVIVVAAEPGRLSQRYGDRAGAYTDIEVGHAAQNIALQAVANGLASVPIAALDAPRTSMILGLPSGQTVVYLLPVGFAA